MADFPTKPPRCLQPFTAKPWIGQLPDSSWDDFTAFLLGCSCGNSTWKVHALLLTELSELDDLLSIECTACQKIKLLFDQFRDGYDAEIEAQPRKELACEQIVWTCPHCNGQAGELVATFGYQYDLSDTTPEESRRIEDFFDAFILWHQCPNDKHLECVIGVECA